MLQTKFTLDNEVVKRKEEAESLCAKKIKKQRKCLVATVKFWHGTIGTIGTSAMKFSF